MKTKKIFILIGLGICFLIIIPKAIEFRMEETPDVKTVKTPEKKGFIIDTIEKSIPYTVYVNNTETIIDSTYYHLYKKAEDSIQKLNLYINAIKIREYNKTLINNDTIRIDAYAKTRGSLLDYSVDYTIKPLEYSYVPEVVYKPPRLSLSAGVDMGIPIRNSNFVVKPTLDLHNKNLVLSVGYDTDNRVWLGVKQTFNIWK